MRLYEAAARKLTLIRLCNFQASTEAAATGRMHLYDSG